MSPPKWLNMPLILSGMRDNRMDMILAGMHALDSCRLEKLSDILDMIFLMRTIFLEAGLDLQSRLTNPPPSWASLSVVMRC